MITYKSVSQKYLPEQWKYTNCAVALSIKRIILFKNWTDISIFQVARKSANFKRFINAIGQYRKCKLTFFQDIFRYIPADRFVALKLLDNLIHIIYRTRNRNENLPVMLKFCLIALMLN